MGMFSISFRFDRRRLASALLLTALVGAGAVCAKEALWNSSISAESRISTRKINTAAANEQQRRGFMSAHRWDGAGGAREGARMLTANPRHGDSIAQTKGLLIAVWRL